MAPDDAARGMPSALPDWAHDYFTPAWQKHYRKTAEKYFRNTSVDPQDGMQDALLSLYERMRSWKEATVTPGLVRTAYRRLIIDSFRAHFGRFSRPPEWVERAGPTWVEVFRLFCTEKRTLAEIQSILSSRFTRSGNSSPGKRIGHMVRHLRRNNACHQREVHITLDSSPEDGRADAPHLASPRGEGPEDVVRSDSRILLLHLILTGTGQTPASATQAVSRLALAHWQQVASAIALTDDERLMLRQFYLEDLTYAQIAANMRLERHQVRYAINRARERIRDAFRKYDIDLENLIDE